MRALIVVEQGIGKYEHTTRPARYTETSSLMDLHSYTSNLPRREYGAPPPAIVLDGELEVCQGYGDASCDTQQDKEDHQQNAVEGIHLTPPHSSKDVIELHGYGTRDK